MIGILVLLYPKTRRQTYVGRMKPNFPLFSVILTDVRPCYRIYTRDIPALCVVFCCVGIHWCLVRSSKKKSADSMWSHSVLIQLEMYWVAVRVANERVCLRPLLIPFGRTFIALGGKVFSVNFMVLVKCGLMVC